MADTAQLIELLTKQQQQHAEQMESFRQMLAIMAAKGEDTQQQQISTPGFAPFDPNAELLSDYMDRFRTFTAAHSIPQGKQANVFLTNQSPTLYKMLSNTASQLTTPKSINELTLEEIEDFLKAQFDPTQFIIRERHKFWSDMSRRSGEKVNELAARIRQDATTCAFNEIGDPLDEAMRTRFMCSIQNEAVLKALFKVKPEDLTFAKAVETAVEIEEASKVAKETVHGQPIDEQRLLDVNKVSNRKPSRQGKPQRHYGGNQPQDKPCFRCGKPGHSPAECRFKTSKCNYCAKEGHIYAACNKRKSDERNKPCRLVTDKPETVHSVKQLSQTIFLNGKQCTMELDTGACGNFISEGNWERLGRPTLKPVTTRYESASCHPIETLGECILTTKLPKVLKKLQPVL
jgi:hypothetical protein